MHKGNVVNMNGMLTTKKKEILPLATTWINLEIIIPGEISQKEKDKHNMLSLTHGI